MKKLRPPDVLYFPFDKPGLEKPWLESAEKNDEYFNYGMYTQTLAESERTTFTAFFEASAGPTNT